MLSKGEQYYLDSLDEDTRNRIVHIKPYDPAIRQLADDIIAEIKNALPDLEVVLTGSLAYGIAGEEDIDISIYCPLEDHDTYRPVLEGLFGKYADILPNYTVWDFFRNSVHVGIWFVDPTRSQTMALSKRLLDAFNAHPDLLKEYEAVKLSMDGKTYKEYQIAKYEFYHKVLGEE